MYPASLPYGISLLVISALTGGLAFYAFRHPAQTGTREFGWLMCAVTEWSAFYAIEILAPTFPVKLFAAKMQYLGIAVVGPFWLALALAYTGRPGWFTPARKRWIIALASLTFILALTNEYHRLIWAEIGLDPIGFPALLSRHGLWFWAYTILIYTFMIAGIVLYLIAYYNASYVYRRQIGIMVLGSLVPLFGNALYITRVLPVKDLDLTPFGFAFSGFLLTWGLFRFSLFNLTPIAASVVVENLRDAVIIMDNHKRIMDMNPIAHHWLGVGEEAIGKSAAAVLTPSDIVAQLWDVDEAQIQLELGEGEQHRWFDTTISPLRDRRGKILGHVIVIHDNTREQTLLNTEQRRSHLMKLLNDITRVSLETSDFQYMLQTLADRAGELLEADGAFITLWDDVNQRVVPSAAYGEFRGVYPNLKLEPDENTLTASVLREGRPLPVEDIRNTPYMNPRLAADVPTRSVLALPLIANDRKLGAVLVSFNQHHSFTPQEVSIGEQASRQISLAISKIQSFEAERRHARQMELLNSITHAALDTSNLQDMVQTLADRMGELLEADGAYITLWDESQHRTIPAAASGDYRYTYRNVKFDPEEKTLTATVLETGQPLVVEDVWNTPFLSRNVANQFPTNSSMLALPLIANEKKLGAALISFNQTHQFTQEEIEIGTRAAAHIALAIYKARLLEISLHQVDHLKLLSEVGRQIANSLDDKEILHDTLNVVAARFDYAEAAFCMLVDENTLEAIAIAGTEDFGYRPGYRQKVGEGIIGHVAETRHHYVSSDVSKDPYYYSTAYRNGSALGVPMLDKNELLGVIYVETIAQNYFNPEDVQTLQTLANQVATSLQKARLYARTQRHLQVMTTLQFVSQVVTSSLELEETLHNVIKLLKDSFGYTYISIYLLKENRLHLGAQVGYPEELIIYDIPIHTGVTGRTVQTKQTQFIPDVSKDTSFLRASYEIRSEICVPLLKNDIVLGVLNVESENVRPLHESDLDLLNALAGPIAIAIDNAQLHAQVKTLAMTDAVTELFNRRMFEETLNTEVQRAARYRLPLSLIIFDVDSFKAYNDTWGHPAGDTRLKAVADLIRANQRKHDIAARYGGDEFAIILPNTDKAGACQFAKRLHKAAQKSVGEKLANNPFVSGFTLSMGVATFPEDGDTLATILQAADQAELMAKQHGKNRIVCASNMKDI